MSAITGYHAHVYFDAADRAVAEQLCKQAEQKFRVTLGRMHGAPVGSHPRGSCQLAFEPDLFGTIVPWLILNRMGLTSFSTLARARISRITPSTYSGLGRPRC